MDPTLNMAYLDDDTRGWEFLEDPKAHSNPFENKFLKKLRLKRIYSIDDHFETEDGTRVEPRPVPGGLVPLDAEWEGSRDAYMCGFDDGECLDFLRKLKRRTKANAAELCSDHRYYAIQLYQI